MKILFDKTTHKVSGFNRPATPFEYEANFDGSPVAEKTLSVYMGEVHEQDEFGNYLYTDSEGNTTTNAFTFIPPVYGEKTIEEDVDGDGTLETVTYKDYLLEEGYQINHTPKVAPLFEDKVITFREHPREFTYEELKDAPLEFSLEQLKEMETQHLQMAIVELFESNIALQLSNSLLKQETENVMLAVTELYEMLLGGGN